MDRTPFARAIFPIHAKMWDGQLISLPLLSPDLCAIVFQYFVPIDGLRELAGLIGGITNHSQHPLTIVTDTPDDQAWSFLFCRSSLVGWVRFMIYPSGRTAPVIKSEVPIEHVWMFAHGADILPIANMLTSWARCENEARRLIKASRCMLLAYLYHMVSARRAASRVMNKI